MDRKEGNVAETAYKDQVVCIEHASPGAGRCVVHAAG